MGKSTVRPGKLWLLLNCAPTSNQLDPPPPSSFEPPPSSLQHPQQSLNQKLHVIGQFPPKIFWLKSSIHCILEMLIPNPDLDFWNSNSKIYFWTNLGPKIQSCLFCLKIGTNGMSRMLILIPALFYEFPTLNSFLGKFGPKKSKFLILSKS